MTQAEDLRDVETIVFDMDGVLYRRDDAIPGSAETIARLRARGVHTIFCTNNSRYSVDEYLDKLAGLGIPTDRSDLLTSGLVTAESLQERGFAGRRAIVVGGDGVRTALTGSGIVVEDDPSIAASDLVVIGWDPGFDYAAMARAARAVRDGATLIATNADATFPAPEGLVPGAGAILASIETASGRRAEVMGKPHRPMTDALAKRVGHARRVAIVGDRPDTDLAAGVVMGWIKVLVLTGVTQASGVSGVEPQPDVVLDSLAGWP